MTKILFVCHGNICRSPMAEFVMKDLVCKAGLEDSFEIASAATSSEELGSPVYPPVRRILSARGINCFGKTACTLTRKDYDKYDILIGMDRQNMRNMIRICGEDSERKMHLLLDFTKHPREVSDPWYTGDFDQTISDVDEGCSALLEKILQNKI